MKKWQKQYNYRRIKDENDVVVRNLIFIDGEPVEVNEEVYKAYSSMARREVYQEKLLADTSPISLEKLAEKNVPIDLYFTEHAPSVEDLLIEKEDEEECAVLINKLAAALSSLAEHERVLVQTLFFDGISAREYGRRCGVSDMAIRKKRDRILKKLKGLLECVNA